MSNKTAAMSTAAMLVYHVVCSPSFALYSQQARPWAPSQGAAESPRYGSRVCGTVCDRDMPAARVLCRRGLRVSRSLYCLNWREGVGLRRSCACGFLSKAPPTKLLRAKRISEALQNSCSADVSVAVGIGTQGGRGWRERS
jgi:hypothetical protein